MITAPKLARVGGTPNVDYIGISHHGAVASPSTTFSVPEDGVLVIGVTAEWGASGQTITDLNIEGGPALRAQRTYAVNSGGNTLAVAIYSLRVPSGVRSVQVFFSTAPTRSAIAAWLVTENNDDRDYAVSANVVSPGDASDCSLNVFSHHASVLVMMYGDGGNATAYFKTITGLTEDFDTAINGSNQTWAAGASGRKPSDGNVNIVHGNTAEVKVMLLATWR